MSDPARPPVPPSSFPTPQPSPSAGLPDPPAGATPGEVHDHWMHRAVALARNCPPSTTAFSVGAVIVGEDGRALAAGWSRETAPHDHAEEAALAKLPPGDERLTRATMYSTLEPCSARASRPLTCTQLILAARIPRVVLAWREPLLFVDCDGAERLRGAGVEVIETPHLAPLARAVNAHLLKG
ncbi:deaminase [Streptomyces sp. ST2-7A]|uniref:deaminase n=1 Tax=Streptomyces sp. ST2-7A TaxID=2907214 RepID=UPI0027E27D1C|nr:deaminase [Streptomyces sp. ST2-7A]